VKLSATVCVHSPRVMQPERWLRDEVAPAYDAHKADPTRAVFLDEGITQVRAESPRAMAAFMARLDWA
jgi:hypothetical protein